MIHSTRPTAIAIVLAIACHQGISPVAAQTGRIYGRVVANPQVADPIDILLEVREAGTGRDVMQIRVDAYSPRRFSDILPLGLDGDVVVKVVVNEPAGYVPWQSEFVKRACCSLRHDITIKRPADVYVEKMDAALAAPDGDRKERLLTEAGQVAEGLAQHVEVQRQLASLYGRHHQFADQQRALSAVYELPDVHELSEQRKAVYWSERLDGILLWSGYTRLRMPEQEFSEIVLNTEDPRGAFWREFIEDFRSAYPGAPVVPTISTADDVVRQLRTVRASIGR